MKTVIAGVDEVGRGPLAGPVVAAAVVLDEHNPISQLTDSKKMTATKRQQFYFLITAYAKAWRVGYANVDEIDEMNILQASLLAMQRAVAAIQSLTIEHAVIDGRFAPKLPCSTETMIQGDLYHPSISAASIVAKVTRDQWMVDYDAIYPHYGFAQHKGYATAAHRQAIAMYGPCDIHRRSFAPIRQMNFNENG